MATRSAAQRREPITTTSVTPTGVNEALIERRHAAHFDRRLASLARIDRDASSPSAAAHFGEGARRIAENLDLGITSQRGVLVAQGGAFRNHKLDHHEGELQ